MNEKMNEQTVDLCPPQEALESLPYSYSDLVSMLEFSVESAKGYRSDCDISLAAEQDRLRRIAEVSGEAKQHSHELQNQQLGVYQELADASDCYVALLDTKQVTVDAQAEKQAQLESEQANQAELNLRANQLKARIEDVAANRAEYHRSLQEQRTRLGAEYCSTGSTISSLQSEIEGIRSEELPALEARIAQELARIMRLHAEVTAITEQITQLVVPTGSLGNQDAYRADHNATRHNKQISDNTAMTTEVEAQPDRLTSARPRQLGNIAVQLDDKSGFFGRVRVGLRK